MPPDPSPSRPGPVPFAEALRFWLKLGVVGFGGPAGQIAIMHAELVERRRWIGERRFLHALNYCTLLPGPEAQQLATYLGWLLHRTWGGVVAGAPFVLPSLLLLVLLSWVYVAYGDAPLVAALFYGIKPAVTAIVLHAAWRIGKRVLTNGVLGAIAAAAFVAIFALEVPFPAIVVAAAAIGWWGGRVAPQRFAAGGAHASAKASYGPALIDGLALGETTPGPLIMVVAFVGFVGAWQSPEVLALFGAEHRAAAAVLAAVLVTWFAFLPSFVFILAGAPLVESTHGRLGFAAPLTAITAAVVGVIVNLALFFAAHVLWPQGSGGAFDAVAAAIAAAAMPPLWRFGRGVIEVLLASAAVGLAMHLLR